MYCSKCGKQVINNAIFCPFCGNQVNNNIPKNNVQPLNTPAQINNQNTKNTTNNSSSPDIGIAFVIIGIMGGVLAFLFAISKGEILGFDQWDYYYGGTRILNVIIALAAVVSLILGLVLKSNSSKK